MGAGGRVRYSQHVSERRKPERDRKGGEPGGGGGDSSTLGQILVWGGESPPGKKSTTGCMMRKDAGKKTGTGVVSTCTSQGGTEGDDRGERLKKEEERSKKVDGGM